MAGRSLICDCAGITTPSLATIDQLARLRLAARERHAELRLRHAGADLLELIEFAGLSDVLGVEVPRQSKKRKQPSGVEEERELGDPAV